MKWKRGGALAFVGSVAGLVAAQAQEVDVGAEASRLADDAGFVRECLDTLAAREAPAHVCRGIVARSCAGESEDETTTGATVCAQRESDAWSALLDEVAAATEAGLDNNQRDAFRSAQAAWGDYRDAQCAFEAGGVGEEQAAAATQSACVLQLTAERVISLHESADGR